MTYPTFFWKKVFSSISKSKLCVTVVASVQLSLLLPTAAQLPVKTMQISRLQIFALGQLFSFQFYRCSYLWFLYTVLYFNFTYRTSTAATRDTIETANDTLLVKSGSSILSSIFSFICLRFISSPPFTVAFRNSMSKKICAELTSIYTQKIRKFLGFI